MEVDVSSLRVHPAQMRTRISAEELGRLATQVKAGFDQNMAILVLDDHTVVSGHRRWLAAMVAHLTPPETGDVVQVIKDLCQPDKDGWIALTNELYSRLSQAADGLLVPIKEWEGDNEIMTLIRANMGPEKPDLLGQARCFKIGLEQGLSVEELAEASGLPIAMARIMSQIPQLPKFWQGLLQDGLLDIEAVPALLQADKPQLSGMARALKHCQDEAGERGRPMPNTTTAVSLSLLRAKEGPPQADRNQYAGSAVNTWEAINRLWHEVRMAHTSSLFEQLTLQVSRGYLEPNMARHWLHVLERVSDLGPYFNQAGLSDKALQEFVPEADCGTCCFSKLPAEKLRYELEPPCREGREGPCWHWAPIDQPFWYRLPWTWIVNSGDVVKSWQELQYAWEQEQQAEMALPPRPAVIGLSTDDDTRPIDAQREAIRQFMESHDKLPFDADHPWATACARCRYHLEASPVQSDPEAPHCQWARIRTTVKFEARIPQGDGYASIPFCFQFRPKKSWVEIIPDGGEPPLPREVLYPLIEKLGNQANTEVYDTACRGVLQFLTGRPEKASGNHRGFFKAQFRQVRDSLSLGQLWTLFQWVVLEWLRVKEHSSFGLVPCKDGLVECGLHQFHWALDEVGNGQKG